jgi:hypothetical protein
MSVLLQATQALLHVLANVKRFLALASVCTSTYSFPVIATRTMRPADSAHPPRATKALRVQRRRAIATAITLVQRSTTPIQASKGRRRTVKQIAMRIAQEALVVSMQDGAQPSHRRTTTATSTCVIISQKVLAKQTTKHFAINSSRKVTDAAGTKVMHHATQTRAPRRLLRNVHNTSLGPTIAT